MDNVYEPILSDNEIFDDGISVATDSDDYAPGATATITATDLDTGSTVTFAIDHVSGPGADGIFGTADDDIAELGGAGHESWSVTDGGAGDLDGEANGVIVTSWYVDPDYSLDETFLLSANDGTETAFFSFTDSVATTPPFTGHDLPNGVNEGDTYYDLTALDSPTFEDANGGIWTNDIYGAGTGVINPFVRLQSQGSEDGVNTSGDLNNDEKAQANGFTRDLLLSEVGLFTSEINDPTDGIAVLDGADGYYFEFRLDINENSNSNGDQYLSLDEVMIFISSDDNLTITDAEIYGMFAGDVADLFYDSDNDGTPTDLELVYDLDAAGDTWVALNYDLQAGSGVGDIALYIDKDDFDAAMATIGGLTYDTTYVYLVSSFGYQGSGTAPLLDSDDNYADGTSSDDAKWQSSDGFEEWSVVKNAIIPASIEGYKYDDTDGDGIADPEDAGIASWYMYLYVDDGDGVFDANDVGNETLLGDNAAFATETINTDGLVGYYNFGGLDPTLSYWLVEANADGWVNTNASVVTIGDFDYVVQDLITLSPGQVYGDEAGEETNFLNFDLFDLSGTKYTDVNGDGDIDPEDTGLGGVTIFIDVNGNGVDDDGYSTVTSLGGEGEAPVGSWSFTDLDWSVAGASVKEITPDGYVQTLGPDTTISGTSGTDQTDLDFANFDLFDLSGTKYTDVNGDGDIDPEDTGLGGVTIFIDVNGNGVDDDGYSTVTSLGGEGEAPVGSWSFTDLDWSVAGASVKEITPDGYVQTLGPDTTISGTSGTDQTDLDFANFDLFDLSGTKYTDVNGDGDIDPEDTGLGGVTIFIDVNGNGVDDDGYSTVTSLGGEGEAPVGSWSFTDLDWSVAGASVKEITPDGYVQTLGPDTTISGTSGTDQTDLDFANFDLFDLSGTKYTDVNGDGDIDPEDTGLGGVTIFIDVNGNGVDDDGYSTVTSLGGEGEAPVGSWSFTDLDWSVAGASVKEITPDGYVQTLGPDTTISGTSGTDQTDLDFANFDLFDLSGTKYTDVNGDGDIDPEDTGLGGVTIFIDVNGNGVDDDGYSTVTSLGGEGEAPVGSWSFTDLDWSVAGASVKEITPDGYVQTLGPDTTISGTSGTDQEDLDFANFELASIAGYKFWDLNRDGAWGEDETGAAGWTIELYADDGTVVGEWDAGDSLVQSTVSVDDGSWSFDGLFVGTYFVKEVLQPGYIQTTPEPFGDGVFKVVVDDSGEVVVRDVNLDGDGLGAELLFGNDQIEGPGVRTPGFWQSKLGQTFWDGDPENDGIIPGTGNTEEKTGNEFADNDLIVMAYGENAVTGDAAYWDNHAGKILIGDWDLDGVLDAASGEDPGEEWFADANSGQGRGNGDGPGLTFDEALSALQGDGVEGGRGKGQNWGKFELIERDLVAAWLNYMAGNPVGTIGDDTEDAAYWIDQAIAYLNYDWTGKTAKKAWSHDTMDGDGDLLLESGSEIHDALDGWNNSGDLFGEIVAFDGDNGGSVTSLSYYEATESFA